MKGQVSRKRKTEYLRILEGHGVLSHGVSCLGSQVPLSWVLGAWVPSPEALESYELSLVVLRPGVLNPKIPVLGSWVLILECSDKI